MRRLVCVGAILVGLAGCASQADHLRVLERREQNLASEIADLDAELAEASRAMASSYGSLALVEDVAVRAARRAELDETRLRFEEVAPKVEALIASKQAELVRTRARIADLVD